LIVSAEISSPEREAQIKQIARKKKLLPETKEKHSYNEAIKKIEETN
jgi:hypothetical protein